MTKHNYGVIIFLLIFFSVTTFAQEKNNLSNVTIDSLLNIKIASLNPRITSASKYDQTNEEVPASVSIITAEDIEKYNYKTLNNVLESVRGFYSSYDRNYNYIGTRGFSLPTDYNDRIILLINGHTLNENMYGSANIGTELALNMSSIEQIEIIRGPGSVLYGTGAMFAVINIITKSGNRFNKLQVTAETGSYGQIQGSIAYGKEFNNGLDFFISGTGMNTKGQNLFYQEYNSPETNNGVADKLDWDRNYGFFTSLAYKDLRLNATFASRRKGIPTGAFGTVFNDSRAYTLDQYYFLELAYNKTIDDYKSLVLRAYGDGYNYNGGYPYDVMSWDRSIGRWYGGELQFNWDFSSNNRLTIGSEIKNSAVASYKLWDESTIYFDHNYPYNVFSVYLNDEYQIFSNLMVEAGIRRDFYSYLKYNSVITPRFGINYSPAKNTTLKFLYGDAFRAPNIYEINYADPTSNFKSNPSLRPEKMRTIEAIVEHRITKELVGTASYYNYNVKDLIATVNDTTDYFMQFQNASRVEANGVEFELKARFSSIFSGYLNYAFQSVKNEATGIVLPNSPQQILKFGMVFPLSSYLAGSTEMRYETSRKTIYNTETPSYFLTNISLSTIPLFEYFRFSLLVRNVFNISYFTPGGFEHKQNSIAQNGRSFVFRIEFNY